MTTNIRIKKDNNKSHKRKSDSSNNKENTTSKNDSITEIHVSDLDTSTEIEDNDSTRWRSLPEMSLNSEDNDTCDMDNTEWLDDNFYQQIHMVSNFKYAK